MVVVWRECFRWSLWSLANVLRVFVGDYSGIVLQKVVEYMVYHEKNAAVEGVADMVIEPELCLEVLMAADYLQM